MSDIQRRAILTIDPIVGEAFAEMRSLTPGGVRSYVEVVARLSRNLFGQISPIESVDKIILAGPSHQGFVDISEVRHQGLLSLHSGVGYDYGNIGNILRGQLSTYRPERDYHGIIVAAFDDATADRLKSLLEDLHYHVIQK